MESTTVRRRLAAILAADLVGYSRLMGGDEVGTLAALKAHRHEIIDPAIAAHRGRMVKTTGDGALVEFASVVDAVGCAVAIQRGLIPRNAGLAEDKRLMFRIGVNVGDIIIDGDDIFGDGVNIAARLEALCEPGGVCLSRAAHDQVRDKLALPFADMGEREVKNIARPVGVFALAARDIAALPEPGIAPTPDPAPRAAPRPARFEQEIRFCMTRDGVQLAYAVMGNGPALVKTGNWLTHLELDYESPVWAPLYRELAADHTLIRYDARGNGLSDRNVEVSMEAYVGDLEAVVDAAGFDRFALFGISQGAPVSVMYAVRHPERVSRLVLFGGMAVGWNRRSRTPEEIEQTKATATLMRIGWGQNSAAIRQMFTTRFMPDATKEIFDWFNEMQRVAITADDAVRYMTVAGDIDVAALLPQVTAPTLVLHSRDDGAVPFEAGRRLATGIPGARFAPLASRSHIIFDGEPAFPRFVEEIKSFLAG
jgi:class 3 adenylate cyclase/pimeloyl-ACP methyl ester carboxylesterase